MKLNDEELVKRALGGEAESFGKLIQRYQGAVQGVAYHLTGSFEDAEDIAQEAFITAYLKLRQLRHPEKFAAWLRQITLNCCKMWIRKRNAQGFLFLVVTFSTSRHDFSACSKE